MKYKSHFFSFLLCAKFSTKSEEEIKKVYLYANKWKTFGQADRSNNDVNEDCIGFNKSTYKAKYDKHKRVQSIRENHQRLSSLPEEDKIPYQQTLQFTCV